MATRGSSKWRTETWGEGCKPQLVTIPIYAGGPKVQVDKRCRDAMIALGAVFLKHGYIVRRIGGYNCRKITGGTGLSSHSWATSIDVNDDTNPYRTDKLVTDMSSKMIAEVYAIKTRGGQQVFRWGGDWDGRPETRNSNYDAMHFECIATPEELATGIARDAGHPMVSVTWPVIREGAYGAAVIELQRLLKMKNTTGTGTFGPRTHKAVVAYQTAHGLTPDGIVGHATWTALLTEQPKLDVCSLPPQKVNS